MTENPTPVILTELTDDGVMILTLNRPERHNAWTLEMELLYNELFDRAEADPAVRAVVLTGAGRSFCPGMDMSVLDGASSGASPWPTGELPPRTRPMSFPKPLVAAVNGACAGIGFNQALMCDVRFAVPDAKFAAAFSARGLVAEDGVSWILPRLVGYGNASDLLLSSRRITGTEALAMGLVNRLVEPAELLPTAIAYATRLASSASPYAMSLIKRQLADDQSQELHREPRQRGRAARHGEARPGLSRGRTQLHRTPTAGVRGARGTATGTGDISELREEASS